MVTVLDELVLSKNEKCRSKRILLFFSILYIYFYVLIKSNASSVK